MKRSHAIALALALTTMNSSARAGDPEPDPSRIRARELAELGDAAFSAGRCDRAIPLWLKAEEAFHAPTIQLRIANCYALLGKVVQAARLMESVASEELAPDAPEAFLIAQQRARAALPTIRARVATLRIVVDRRGIDASPAIFVDDEPVEGDLPRIEVDPGTRHVRVEVGDVRWERKVRVEEHGHVVVHAALERDVPPPPARPQRTVGLVLGGVGLATAAVGSYFGVRALRTSSNLKDVCGPRLDDCPSDRQGDIDQVQRDAKIADLTMATGGVLFLAGAVVMIVESPPPREAPTLRVVPVGLGAGVQGAF